MLTRARPLIAVAAFALAVAVLAVFAAKSDDHRLVKLPVASLGGAAADEASADQAAAAPSRSSLAYAPLGEYRVEGTLPDLPATAPAYRLGSATTAAAVAKLASSLGLKGDVKAEPDAWVVRAGDRELRVQRFGGLPWYLGQACEESKVTSDVGGTVASCSGTAVATQVGGGSSSVATTGDCPPDAECIVPDPAAAPTPDPIPVATKAPSPPACDPGTACTDAPAAPCKAADASCGQEYGPCPSDGTCVVSSPPAPVPARDLPAGVEPAAPPPPSDLPLPEPPVQPPRPADLPSRQEADKIAREGFARLGVGTEGFVLDDGWFTWEARVESRVDGLAVVGLGTSLSVGPNGEIVQANGFLAVPDRIGDYPLVGVPAGLKRLTTGFGSGPGPRRLTADDKADSIGAPEPAIAPCTDEPAVTCEPTLQTTIPVQPVLAPQVITGVHLALLQLGDSLVPAYAFELAGGGGSIPVPAVTDEWLDQQASTLKD